MEEGEDNRREREPERDRNRHGAKPSWEGRLTNAARWWWPVIGHGWRAVELLTQRECVGANPLWA